MKLDDVRQIGQVISVDSLSKRFAYYERTPGLLGAIKGLVTAKKQYVRALDSVSLTVEKAERHGLIGPNGAGKTTLLRLLTGIMKPDQGIVRVLGRDPWVDRERNARDVGVVFGQRSQLIWETPPYETYVLHKKIYEIPEDVFEESLGTCREILGLGDFEKQPVRQLSLGQRTRANLAMAFLHRPKIVYLDEPTLGIDALTTRRIKEFLRYLSDEKGLTVILTSHNMADMEALAQSVCVLDSGRIKYKGTLTDLRSRYAPNKILRFQPSQRLTQNDVSRFPCQARVDEARDGTQWVNLMIAPKADLADVGDLLARLPHGVSAADIVLMEIPIEDVVREIYSNSDNR